MVELRPAELCESTRVALRTLHRGRLPRAEAAFDWIYGRAGGRLLCAWLNGGLVGHVGWFDTVAFLGGKMVAVRHVLDLFVSPAHRGRGLASALLGEATREQLTLVLGMTEAAEIVFRRCGYRDLGTLPARVRPSLLARQLRVFGRRAPAMVSVQESSASDDELDQFWGAVAAGFPAVALRDAKTIRCRYLESPLSSYRCWTARRGSTLVGWLVARSRNTDRIHQGLLVDGLVAHGDQDAWHALVVASVTGLESAGANVVRISSGAVWVSAMLSREWFVRVPSRIPMVGRAGLRFMVAGPGSDAVPGVESWWLTRGDGETDWGDLSRERDQSTSGSSSPCSSVDTQFNADLSAFSAP
jgi:GNAT superfamily N-acetyltransferase